MLLTPRLNIVLQYLSFPTITRLIVTIYSKDSVYKRNSGTGCKSSKNQIYTNLTIV